MNDKYQAKSGTVLGKDLSAPFEPMLDSPPQLPAYDSRNRLHTRQLQHSSATLNINENVVNVDTNTRLRIIASFVVTHKKLSTVAILLMVGTAGVSLGLIVHNTQSSSSDQTFSKIVFAKATTKTKTASKKASGSLLTSATESATITAHKTTVTVGLPDNCVPTHEATYLQKLTAAFDDPIIYVGFESEWRLDIDKSASHSFIWRKGFPAIGQKVVGVRLYPSKLSSLSPVNFGIYSPLPGDCKYKLVKCYTLKFESSNEEVELMFPPEHQFNISTGSYTWGFSWYKTPSNSGNIYYTDNFLANNDINYCMDFNGAPDGAVGSFRIDRKASARKYSIQAICV